MGWLRRIKQAAPPSWLPPGRRWGALSAPGAWRLARGCPARARALARASYAGLPRHDVRVTLCGPLAALLMQSSTAHCMAISPASRGCCHCGSLVRHDCWQCEWLLASRRRRAMKPCTHGALPPSSLLVPPLLPTERSGVGRCCAVGVGHWTLRAACAVPTVGGRPAPQRSRHLQRPRTGPAVRRCCWCLLACAECAMRDTSSSERTMRGGQVTHESRSHVPDGWGARDRGAMGVALCGVAWRGVRGVAWRGGAKIAHRSLTRNRRPAVPVTGWRRLAGALHCAHASR